MHAKATWHRLTDHNEHDGSHHWLQYYIRRLMRETSKDIGTYYHSVFADESRESRGPIAESCLFPGF